MKVKIIIRTAILIIIMVFSKVYAQDVQYARSMIDSLCSEQYWGRGYTKDGMLKVAKFIQRQFESLGMKPITGKSMLQSYQHPANTFPGAMKLEINGQSLHAGTDYIVHPESRGVQARGIRLVAMSEIDFMNEEHQIAVRLVDKLTWRPATKVLDCTIIEVLKSSLKDMPERLNIKIVQEFQPHFEANNVIATIPGTHYPDSFIFITAHYDHLGGMGQSIYFPGANDNASGTAMMLDMTRYYKDAPLPYTLVFVAFGSEEIGLLGSQYFVENPWVTLGNIKFLMNIDLMGNGEDGITVVNASTHPNEFQKLQNINDSLQLLPKINERGKAANSDHHFFVEAGVPAFFIYTLGGTGAYHDVHDIPLSITLPKYNETFQLITSFLNQL